MRKGFMRTWRWRKEGLGVFSYYAKRHKSVYIFVNNNTNLNFFKILSNYTIWDRLSQKNISLYCPFKFIWESGRDEVRRMAAEGPWIFIFIHTSSTCTHFSHLGDWVFILNVSPSLCVKYVAEDKIIKYSRSTYFVPYGNEIFSHFCCTFLVG